MCFSIGNLYASSNLLENYICFKNKKRKKIKIGYLQNVTFHKEKLHVFVKATEMVKAYNAKRQATNNLQLIISLHNYKSTWCVKVMQNIYQLKY